VQRQRRPYAIEPLNIPQDRVEQLKQYLESGKGDYNARKSNMARLTGRCSECRGIPTKVVKYKTQGVIKVERYCNDCLAKLIPVQQNY
jgi:hypothetical protein